MAAKRKRVDLDLNAKINTLKQVDGNVKRKDIADKYGIRVSTVAELIKIHDKLERYFHSSFAASNCKRMLSSSYVNVADALLNWFKQKRFLGMPVSGPMLAGIAERLVWFGLTVWKCLNRFLERLKKRHNIAFKAAAGVFRYNF
jgi:hypothetical protein